MPPKLEKTFLYYGRNTLWRQTLTCYVWSGSSTIKTENGFYKPNPPPPRPWYMIKMEVDAPTWQPPPFWSMLRLYLGIYKWAGRSKTSLKYKKQNAIFHKRILCSIYGRGNDLPHNLGYTRFWVLSFLQNYTGVHAQLYLKTEGRYSLDRLINYSPGPPPILKGGWKNQVIIQNSDLY